MDQKIRRVKKHGLTLDNIRQKQNEKLNIALRNLDTWMTNFKKTSSQGTRNHANNGNT